MVCMQHPHPYSFDLLCCNNNPSHSTERVMQCSFWLAYHPLTQWMHYSGRKRENPCKAKGYIAACILEQHTYILRYIVCTPHCTTIQCRGAATQLNPTPRAPYATHSIAEVKSIIQGPSNSPQKYPIPYSTL